MNCSDYNLKFAYDKYSAMLYGLALEISPTQKLAESILINTFQKVTKQNLQKQNQNFLCAILIKLLIDTARQQLNPANSFKLRQFTNTPILAKFLCEQVTLQDHYKEHKLTRMQATKKIREEFNLIRRK